MIKKTITYTDMDGVELVEDFYFHLFSPEVFKLEAEYGMDLERYVKAMANSGDISRMIAFLENIILSSYGVRTNNGKSFDKSDELRKNFQNSQAYAELFEEILTNPSAAQSFASGLISKKAKSGGVETTPSAITDTTNN